MNGHSKIWKKYNKEILEEKPESMALSREPVRCNFFINKPGHAIISYLGKYIFNNADYKVLMYDQVLKSELVGGCLNCFVCENNFLNEEIKVRLCKKD